MVYDTVHGWMVYEGDPMIKLSDLSYPYYLWQLRNNPQGITFGDHIYEEDLRGMFGYAPILQTTAPTGDVVAEIAPVIGDDGKGHQEYFQTWSSRPYNAEELAALLAQAQEQAHSSAQGVFTNDLVAGVPYVWDNAGTSTTNKIPFKVEQRANLLILRQLATDRIAKADTTTFRIHTAESTWLTLAPADLLTFVDAVFATYAGYLDTYWDYLTRVGQTTLYTSVPNVPSTFTTPLAA